MADIRPELLSSQGLRLDGRRPNELSRIQCKLGHSSSPDGSAYLEHGNSKVLAAVYGPRQASKEKMLPNAVALNCQFSMATFATAIRKVHPPSDRKIQEMSSNLKQALLAAILTELHPRSQIDVFIEVLQEDGNSFCAGVNAACLALIDAGIPLRSYVCACSASIAFHPGGPTALIDVNQAEEAAGCAVLTVVSLPRTGTMTCLTLTHKLHADYFEVVTEAAMQGCRDIMEILDKAVKEHLGETWPRY